MAVAWFISGVKTRSAVGANTGIYIAMDDFTTQIVVVDGGQWRGIYVGPNHNRALVKVSASAGTLTTIAADAAHLRIPVTVLDNTLASLSNAQKTAVQTQLTAMGYTNADVTAALPNLGAATLRQLLEFARSSRNAPGSGIPETVEPLSYLDGVT